MVTKQHESESEEQLSSLMSMLLCSLATYLSSDFLAKLGTASFNQSVSCSHFQAFPGFLSGTFELTRVNTTISFEKCQRGTLIINCVLEEITKLTYVCMKIKIMFFSSNQTVQVM